MLLEKCSKGDGQTSIFFAMPALEGDLLWVQNWKISCFVLEQLTQAGSSFLAAHACFSITYVCSRGVAWFECARLNLSPVPGGFGWVWLGWHTDCTMAQLCTDTHTQNYKKHRQMIPQSSDLCIPNYCNDMETLQNWKHLAFPPPFPVNTVMSVFEEESEHTPYVYCSGIIHLLY